MQLAHSNLCVTQLRQTLVSLFLEDALGMRQGELGALRSLGCDFDNMSISVQHSYYWRRGGNLKGTRTEASAKLLPVHPSLKYSLQEWRSQSLYHKPEDFVVPSERLQGSSKRFRSSFSLHSDESASRVWAGTRFGTRKHAGGDGEHQLTLRDYLRHSNLHVTNHYLQATFEDQTLSTGQIGRRHLADGYFAEDKPNPNEHCLK
jgi:integrase